MFINRLGGLTVLKPVLRRREGVLHQIEKLTDPDYSLTSDVSEYNLSWSQVEILSLFRIRCGDPDPFLF